MSKTTDTTIGGGLLPLDQRINRRFFSKTTGVASKKRLLFRRDELKTLPSLSQFPEAADAWNLLSSGEKDAWENAGLVCGLSGYSLFLQDKIYRLINSIAGNATPSLLHQYLVGHIFLPPSGGDLLVLQAGADTFSITGDLTINVKTNLSEAGSAPHSLIARFLYNYDDGGTPAQEITEINISPTLDWQTLTSSVVLQTPQSEHWELQIEAKGYAGDFWFDNYYFNAVSGVFTKDPFCLKIASSFNKPILPNGALIESVYPAD